MPGTIQVSVLEFKGLPSASRSTVLKVALGKKEYQTSDMGDFSFPLTSLRDDLVVKLQDAEGNEITQTVIQTMSIVEKVCWNDIFHLDRGGNVHLQLQFILSDEERNRIRFMREAAMKKKQVSISNVIPGQSEIASSKIDPVMPSLQAEHMVSGKNVEKGGYLKDSDPKDVTEAAEPISRRKKPFVAGTLKTTGKGREEVDAGRSFANNIVSRATNRLKQSNSAAIESRRKDSSSRELAKSSIDLERPSLVESASISGRKLDHNSGGAYSFDLSAERQDSGGTSCVEGRRKNGSAEVSVQVASSGKSKSLAFKEEELFRFELSGMWIFPNDRKPLCITTAGKRVMNLLGTCNTEARSHLKKKSSSVAGHVDEISAHHGTEHEKKKDHNTTHNLRKSGSESSSSDTFGGLVAQAIKVAIIVGFGVLVFLTRQREPRKSNKDTTDLFFKTSEFMDEQTLTAEKMDLQ